MKKRMFALMMAFAMLFSFTVPVAAASGPSKAALKAYGAKLKKSGSQCNFALIYFDNNTMPELVITSKYGAHVAVAELYTYKSGKVVQVKNAGSDYGRMIYVPKKSVAVQDAWVNGYGSITKFIKYDSKYKAKTLATFDTNYTSSGKTIYKYNKSKVSKTTYNSKWKTYNKKYPGKILYPSSLYKVNTTNINKMIKNYKSFVK